MPLCTAWPSHSQWPNAHISFITTMRLPILQLLCRLFFLAKQHITQMSAPLQPRFGSLRLLVLPKAKIIIEREEICECDGHTVHKLSQRHLTAEWLAPQKSDCSRMYGKVFSDWMPSYIKATWPVLKTFKMDRYFPDSTCTTSPTYTLSNECKWLASFMIWLLYHWRHSSCAISHNQVEWNQLLWRPVYPLSPRVWCDWTPRTSCTHTHPTQVHGLTLASKDIWVESNA